MAEQLSQNDSDSSESDQEDAEETERERNHDLSKDDASDNCKQTIRINDNYNNNEGLDFLTQRQQQQVGNCSVHPLEI